jgi:hypothetical protein
MMIWIKYSFTASLGKKTLYFATCHPLEIDPKGSKEYMHRRLRQEGVPNAVGYPTLALDTRERFNECK